MKLRNNWRAGYAETCTSGSEGGSEKPGLATDKGAWFLPYKSTSVSLPVPQELLGEQGTVWTDATAGSAVADPDAYGMVGRGTAEPAGTECLEPTSAGGSLSICCWRFCWRRLCSATSR